MIARLPIIQHLSERFTHVSDQHSCPHCCWDPHFLSCGQCTVNNASILITLWSISQEIVHVWRVKKKIKSNYNAPLTPSCACNVMEVQISAIFYAYYIKILFSTIQLLSVLFVITDLFKSIFIDLNFFNSKITKIVLE